VRRSTTMYFRVKTDKKTHVVLQAVDDLWNGTVVEEISVSFSDSDELGELQGEFYFGARQILLFIEKHLNQRLRTRD
jgi:hypothetical protein